MDEEPVNAAARKRLLRTSTHWGAYDVEVDNGRIVALHPFPMDPDPSPLGRSIPGAVDGPARIRRPMVRKGWLDNGPRANVTGRGDDVFVAVGWDQALDLVATELRRIRDRFGNESIFGGSYGWSSAGKFHYAQGQLHRFLNGFGGYASHVNTYSLAAGEVILPRVLGMSIYDLRDEMTTWPMIAEHCQLMIMFGGVPDKNGQVVAGGSAEHTNRVWLRRCKEQGVRFINISPLRDDASEDLEAEWWPIRPNTDVAFMMGLAHTLISDDLCDRDFLATHCVGYEQFRTYLFGETDGQAKTADWAAQITGIEAESIRQLAREIASSRTLINASWSLQRADHGEQAFWMAITLAAVVGQIGLPGGGFGLGYGSLNRLGDPTRLVRGPSLPQGTNPVKTVVPVARISDMLLQPGTTIDYNGGRVTFPDIRLIYWAGGNPFHHQQDTNRLLQAWQRPETIVVHEPWWNAHAKHADIVLPATTPLERNDIGCGPQDNVFFAMHRAIDPVGQARNDDDIFSDLAARLGFHDTYTEGRDEMGWLSHLYDIFRQRTAEESIDVPSFPEFWEAGHFEIPRVEIPKVLFREFRRDPQANPLGTPSGRIEIFSSTIDGFGYDDCPGHPVWLEPAEWLGSPKAARFPLHLISNQPHNRLHSQYDNGAVSLESKIDGREPICLHPEDASVRGIRSGDVVRVYNDRGECLAGAVVTDLIRPGVVRLPTGAWFDPLEPGKAGSLCVHGSANMMTLDKGTSKLAQGPSAMTTLVEVERYTAPLPPIRAFDPPPTAGSASD